MSKRFIFLPLSMLVFLFASTALLGQDPSAENTKLVQFSGLVLDGTDAELVPVPYTNILIRGKGRGTYSDFTGFFSIVVEKGDVVEFSAIGYRSTEFVIPDTLQDNRYSLVQLMSRDTINLPTAVIFPWPSREHFRLEFLALDVGSDLQAKATRNVAEESLRQMRQETGMDANENADFYLRQQARNYYHIGQAPPMNIFNPIAWKQFFDAWKRGEYKR